MITFNVQVKVVDENGDTLWTELKIMPSDDPNEDWLDMTLADDAVLPANGNLMVDDPVELIRALNLAVAERKRVLAEDSEAERVPTSSSSERA